MTPFSGGDILRLRRSFIVRQQSNVAMASAKFAYIWQYFVEDSHRDEFLEAYGPNGNWVQLFSRDPSYVETRLLHDADDDGRYVTIDYWVSRNARDSFREKYSREFSILDEKCEQLTTKEEFLGDFVLVDDSAA